MNRKNIWIILILLISFNLLLLLGLYKANQRILQYKNEFEEITARFYDINGKGGLRNVTSQLYREIYVDTNIVKPTKKIMLLALIGEKGCAVCIAETINYLNAFYKTNKDYLKVLFIGKDKKNYEKLNFNLPVDFINEKEQLFSSELKISFPSIILIDKNNLIHSIYRAESGVETKLKVFDKKIKFLINNLK